jgi:AMP deaminase
LYHIYKRLGEINNFAEMIFNIFAPLFEVSIDPSSNPALHTFLQTVVGFDSVDDESQPEIWQTRPNSAIPEPNEWDMAENPPYSYWSYYLYINIKTLNQLRASKGLNTFEFRPHAGEAGDVEHLMACYLVADKINHGILLQKLPALNYLYYLDQIGVAVSPLSNNNLFLDFNQNPFPKFFAMVFILFLYFS